MTLHRQFISDIPEETYRVAKAIFPQGNLYMQMRDVLGTIYADEQFANLYPNVGQLAEAPWRLALVTVMQFAENLTDRQAAEAVRVRIDWKYALGLELTDTGFHFSVLSGFRARLASGQSSEQLLNTILERCKSLELLKIRSKQRTDSTHILASIRMLNRLEQVGEMLRYTLNKLAQVAPLWLKSWVDKEWFIRYGDRFENQRLPSEKQEREVLAQTIGADGYTLLQAIYDETAPCELHKLEAVQLLQRMWIEQFYLEDDAVRWRTKDDLPPSDKMLTSPYDPDARYSHKRLTTWIGYKVHLTESCEADLPCLITHVETTSATTQDVEVVDDVHADLAQQDLLPGDHFVDMGYMSSDVLVTSQQQSVDLVGPVRADTSWQAQTEGAYDITQFQIDWEQQTVRCPMGKISSYWREGTGKFGKPNVNAGFKSSDCRPCTAATRCTRNKKNKARALTFPQQAEYQALQAARERQKTDDFKERYQTRSGVEGLISQAAFTLGMRRARYRGIDKTHLQNLATASAINVLRAVNWLIGKPKAKTRISHFAALAA